jgi:uncharacterized membrane protein
MVFKFFFHSTHFLNFLKINNRFWDSSDTLKRQLLKADLKTTVLESWSLCITLRTTQWWLLSPKKLTVVCHKGISWRDVSSSGRTAVDLLWCLLISALDRKLWFSANRSNCMTVMSTLVSSLNCSNSLNLLLRISPWIIFPRPCRKSLR